MIPIRDDNPTGITPYVTFALIGACAAVFLWQLTLGGSDAQVAVYTLGVIPALLLGNVDIAEGALLVPPAATVFTSMFLHGGWLHFLSNMLYMWIFADNVEDAMGPVRFVIFYLVCGTAAVFAQALPEPNSTVPMIGASGAISGVLGAYLLLYPHARVLVALPLGFYLHVTRFPAMAVLGLWFGMQLLSEVLTASGSGGVAFRAHIGGFVAGMLLIPIFKHARVPLFQPHR